MDVFLWVVAVVAPVAAAVWVATRLAGAWVLWQSLDEDGRELAEHDFHAEWLGSGLDDAGPPPAVATQNCPELAP